MSSTALVRPQRRVIAGVCGALAARTGMRPTTMRLLFVLSCLLPGPQFIAYVVMWVVIPSE